MLSPGFSFSSHLTHLQLLLQAPVLRAASLGGGPGFDFLALVLVATYLGGGGDNGATVDVAV